MGREEIGEVAERLRPDRIGHGILAARDPGLMHALRELGTVLEICPTSNLLTGALEARTRCGRPSAASSTTASRSRSPPTAPR